MEHRRLRVNRTLRWIFTVVGILLVVGLLAGLKGAQIGKLIAFGKKAEADGPPPEIVGTMPATEQEWEGSIGAVGSVTSAKGVALSADASGTVTRIAFESGATVKKGDVLVELDTSVERAQLASAQARRQLANTTIGRTRQLAASGAISAAQLDSDEASLRTATTDADGISAQIARKTIRAPFDGKLGIRQVNLGQFLQPGTPVTVLETIDAVHIDFTLPQQRLGDLTVGMPIRVVVEGTDGGGGAPLEGKLSAVDPTVDPITRSIRLRGDVTSGKVEGLRPGMFVQVDVLLAGKTKRVTVPATAVVHAPYGDSVFVVEARKADAPGSAKGPNGEDVKNARQQFVKIAGARGDFVAVADGVKAGEELVTAGAFKLRNNVPIIVDNKAKQPKPELNPTPENK